MPSGNANHYAAAEMRGLEPTTLYLQTDDPTLSNRRRAQHRRQIRTGAEESPKLRPPPPHFELHPGDWANAYKLEFSSRGFFQHPADLTNSPENCG
jgi:hypothetical protein